MAWVFEWVSSLFPLRIYTALKQQNTLYIHHSCLFPLRIYTALKLVLSQLMELCRLFPLRIYTALKPLADLKRIGVGLFPLRIYTALKLSTLCLPILSVCFPYEFTLLSNNPCSDFFRRFVCFPYEFTLLSNCSTNSQGKFGFVSPTNLHCSQTELSLRVIPWVFVSPTNLHCSQTVLGRDWTFLCLFPLRIYTALKLSTGWGVSFIVCFPYEFTLLSN